MCVRARCISHLRKQQTLLKAKNELSDEARWRIETSLGVLSDSGLSDRLYREEILEIFNKELVRMPKLTKDIFLASREEEMTYMQIAARFNVSRRKVTSEIQRALNPLRRSLKDYLCK